MTDYKNISIKLKKKAEEISEFESRMNKEISDLLKPVREEIEKKIKVLYPEVIIEFDRRESEISIYNVKNDRNKRDVEEKIYEVLDKMWDLLDTCQFFSPHICDETTTRKYYPDVLKGEMISELKIVG